MRAHSIGLLLLTALPAAAFAQVHTTSSPGRVAGIAPPPPTPPAPGSYHFHQVPMVVSSDGRVYADFGRGYEQLVRNCAVPFANFNQPVTTQPVVTQPQPYTPPVPNQQTASQQALNQPSGSSTQQTNARACWSTDNRGQPLIGK
jgi:hypothetical protein